jgi:transposase
MTGAPDEVVPHQPCRCAGRGKDLAGAPMAGVERRQVTDLPPDIRALVTEHRLISRRCGCGMVTAAAAPAGAAAPVQYGPRLSAIGAYLWHGQFLSRNRTCQAMAELFGVPVSPGGGDRDGQAWWGICLPRLLVAAIAGRALRGVAAFCCRNDWVV